MPAKAAPPVMRDNVAKSPERRKAMTRKAMKKMAASLRVELAQYRELESFSQFGSELDKDTLSRLEIGRAHV